jgi:two-component system cell cycle response regulator DivK
MTSRNVLLVNGDEPTRDIYQTHLESNGYAVRQARSGLEALGLVEQSVPDLIVQELDLGTFGGLELIRALRAEARTRAVSIIVVSARVLDGDREDARVAGCDAFLSKPCTPSQMLAQVHLLLPPS